MTTENVVDLDPILTLCEPTVDLAEGVRRTLEWMKDD